MRRAGRLRWLGPFGLAVLSAGSRAHAQSRLVDDSLRSPSIEANLLGDSPTRHILIYLPPSYALDDGRRYPAVYLLHGFNGTPAVWTSGLRIRALMDSLVAAGAIREFVVVMPDGSTALGGSAFTNSTTTGAWETYLIRDVVRFIESRYRTIRRGSSRGIAGHSMGAAAALRVAMRFPGIFGAVYAMSPNATLPCETLSAAEADTLLRLTRRSQRDSIGVRSQVCLGYAADWSPDSARAPFFADLPFTRDHDHIVPDTAVLERWRAWRLLDMAPRYREGLVRLRGIAFDVGDADPYGPGVARLDSLLTRLRVRHSFEFYSGDHSSGIRDRVTGHLLPWFSSVLDFGPEEM
jgi:pimeloyl-ACP methyl ester carboxylesterase